MHGKDLAVALPFARHAGILVTVTPGVNTDVFGTFTGEIARQGSSRDTAQSKARLAVQVARTRLGLGSEGSFGPHPAIPFAPCNTEVIALVDAETNASWVESLSTLRTNYAHLDVSSLDDAALKFLGQVRFPSHAVVVSSPAKNAPIPPTKGIKDPQSLRDAVQRVQNADCHALVRLSTDMRAHLNPTRMGIIRVVAARLARRIATLCPACASPGFGERSLERGIPCAWCGEPVPLPHSLRLTCGACGFSNLHPLARATTSADPRYCPGCNP